jgi:hypothetical protein
MANLNFGTTAMVTQPVIFPKLHYINRYYQSDVLILLNHVQATPRSTDEHGNRQITGQTHMHVGGCQEPAWLPIPIKSKRSLIADAKLGDGDWRNSIKKQLDFRYQHAPHWNHRIRSEIYWTIDESEFLDQLAWRSIEWCLAEMHIYTKIIVADSDLIANTSTFNKDERLLELCKAAGCSNMILGRPNYNYLNIDAWNNANITLTIQEWSCPQYAQHKNNWYPNLSALDAIAYLGGKAAGELVR